MKNRILLLLMVLSLLAVSAPCYATQIHSESETAQSTVYYTVESSFCVVIPTAIYGDTAFQMTADYINILNSQQVNVYLNGENRIPLTNENGDTMNIMFVVDGTETARLASFATGQLESGIYVSCQPCFDSTPKAGNYSGTAEFIVRLEYIGS